MKTQTNSHNNYATILNRNSRTASLKFLFTLIAVLCICSNAWGAWTGSGAAVKEVNGVYYVVYQDSYETLNTVETGPTINLSGPGATLTYEARRQWSGVNNFYYSYSTDKGKTWTDKSQSLDTDYETYTVSLANNVNAIRFLTKTGATLNKYVENIRVTMAQYIENPSQTSFEFGEGKVGDTNSTGTFTIPWCNVPSMTYTLSGTGADCLSVSVANNSDAGKYNTATFTITYDRSKASTLNATLTIKNTYGNYSKTITITGSTTKYDQTLSWNNESAIELNMQLNSTQTVTATATSGLAVTYTSSDESVLKVDADGNLTAVGLGKATITASQAGNYKYNEASSITKTYTVWNKSTPIFTPSGFNETDVCNLKVGDKVTLEVLNVSDGLDGDFKVNTDNNILGITRSGKTITIEALNAGTADATFTQTENDNIFGAVKKYQFSVTKIDNTLAIASTSYTKYVDDVITNIISSVNSDATITTTSSDATIAYYDVTNNNIQIPNSDAKSFSSQTITITIAQAETYKYTAAEKTITLTVNKYTPTFTWNEGGATYYYLSSINNIFSTTNNDFGYTIVSDNEYSAKVIDNTLHIYNVEETANITVTQEENYKWNGKTETYTITPKNPNNHVTFTYNQAMFNDGTITTEKVSTYGVEWTSDNQLRLGGSSKTVFPGEPAYDWDDKYVIIHFEGIPKDISFKHKTNTTSASNGATALNQADWYIAESADGANWSNAWENLGGSNSNSDNWQTISNIPLKSTTSYLKLCYSGNFAGFYSDVVVTELFQFAASPDPLDFGTESATGVMQTKQVVFEHANAGRETTVTIEGADAKFFSVSPTTIANTGRDLYGTVYLDVTFDNDGEIRGANPYNATLIITDNAGKREEVALTGIRDGKGTPVFTWNPNNFPYYFNTTIANIAISSNTDYANCPLTFTTSDASIAEVKDGTLHIYQTGQEVTITVSQGENADYYAHTETFTFTPKSKPDLTVPFHVDGTIYTNAITVSDKCSWDGGNNQMKLGDGAWDDSKKTAILVFSEIPDKLSFSYATSYGLAVIEIGSTANPKWMVEESADGTSWNTIWEQSTNSTSWNNVEIQLSETTQYVRFSYDGNYAGYFRNINVTALDGYKYLRATDGQYLSRGNYWGTQAVVDAFGMACRITRYTRDNVNQYTQFRFVDNAQYLYEADNHELFTDHGTAANSDNLWQINNNGGILTIQSGNTVGDDSKKGYYVTLTDNVLALTDDASAATKWEMEDYTEHDQYIIDMLNHQAAEAAKEDFGADVNTLEKVRNRLKTNDFDIISITIPELTLGEQKGEYREESGTFAVYDQTITGLEPGFYRLTVKALYRMSESDIAWQCKKSGLESVLAYAYANDVKYPIQSVYDSYHSGQLTTDDELRDSKYYSTTLESADKAFDDANRYLNDVYVYIEADPGKETGTLHYGIKNPSYVPGAWLAYEQITLTLFKRKEFIFEGTDATQPTKWTVAENWNTNTVPDHRHIAIIQANVEIDTEASAYEIILDTKTTPNVTATIAPTGGLTVGAGGITGATTDNFIIKAETTGTNKGQTGYIRISPHTDQPMPYATMQLYSKAYYDMEADDRNNVGSWQYVGSPMVEGTAAKSIYKSSWIYDWNEKTAEWENNRKTLKLQPFEGYCTSQYKYPDGILISNTGQLASNGNVELKLTYSGNGEQRCNVFANSYAAPIDITEFSTSDFSTGVEATIHLFNTGSRNDIANQEGQTDLDLDAPGQYISIPIATAANLVSTYGYPSVIPAMQGFFVNTTQEGTLKLDYDRLVWSADYTQHPNVPLRIKAQHENDEQTDTTIVVEPRPIITGALCVTIEANGWKDNLFMLESDSYDANYENGFDARKMMNGNLNIFAVEEYDTYLSVDATHSLINTYIGVRAGTETTYTFTFSHLRAESNIALVDNETEQTIQISEGMTYTFSLTPNTTVTDRFVIVEGEQSEINTNINTITSPTKVHKFIKDNQLFILKNGVLYNAQGQLVSTNVQ